MRPVRMHLACGDTIVQGGLLVELSKKYGAIAVPAYRKYEVFTRSLFRLYPEISVYLLPDLLPEGTNWGAPPDKVFDAAMAEARLDKAREIRLGTYRGAGVGRDGTRGTYLSAGVPYEKRWDSCPIEEAAKYVEQVEWPTENRVFFHDDPARNFRITKLVDRETAFFPKWVPNLLSYVHILKTAEEIHVIDSAFFCLVNQLVVKAKLFFHRYVRFDPTIGAMRLNWNYL